MSSKQPTIERTSPAATQAGTEYSAQMGLGTHALGSSDDTILKLAFPTSPIYLETITDDTLRNTFSTELQGERSLNTDFSALPNEDYTATRPIDMDYNYSPKIDDTLQDSNGDKVGMGLGMPAGPFVPTTASPAGLSTDPRQQPPKNATHLGHNGNLGSVLTPADTATSRTITHEDGTTKTITGVGKSAERIKNLTLGKSTFSDST